MQMRLGDLLVEHGLITENELKVALENQSLSDKKRLGEILVAGDQITKTDLIKMLALQLEIPFLDLEMTEIDASAVKLFPEKLAHKYGCVPVRQEDKELLVALADPLNLQAVDDLNRMTGCEIRLAVADKEQIEAVIKKYHRSDRASEISDSLPELDSLFKVVRSSEVEESQDESVTDLKSQSQQAPIIKIVNIIINEAIEESATDIHVEPQSDSLIVRDRIDGVLYEMHHLPQWIHRPVVSRIKIMADMDIAEKRIPQDGKVRISVGPRYFDLRINTLPSIFGEKVAIRLLERRGGHVKLDELGFNETKLEKMRHLNTRKQGLILVTGPTGSGKSTTLNAILREIRSPKTNIVTVEDPVEYEIPRINQVQINPKAGLSFPFVLRAILRQDPDIIMVGEIRDPETAEIALRAAMTGHLVLSTLHTNDAPSAVTRLANLGMPPYLISSSLLYVVAQRLVRKLCMHCVEDYEPSQEEIEQVELILQQARTLPWKRGKGCPKCKKRGYLGRLAVSELFVVNSEIRQAIESNQAESVVQSLANQNGMTSLMDDFIEKIENGMTGMNEVWNVVVGEETTNGLCPHCHIRVEPSYTVCPSCGHSLKDRCPSCGKTLEKNWRFCPGCQKERYVAQEAGL
jgi:type IV pilus assembly protein PilB